MRAFLLTFLYTFGALASISVWANPDDLPDIGSSADTIVTTGEEYQIGRMVMRGLRQAERIVEDPLLTEYVDGLGHRLVVHAHDGEHRFNFFVVRDNNINAFALPGGFIGVNTGLILATEHESELAGVMAHEIAHVTQRHIARRVQATMESNLVSTAALIAAILLSITSGMDADGIQAMIAVAQGVAAQQQINYTRSNEKEADRVGIGYLAAAGFDPNAMATFFETMSRSAGLASAQVPEILRSHPTGRNRIAEARDRAARMPQISSPDSPGYLLMKERIRVLMADNENDALDYYQAVMSTGDPPYPDHIVYGLGLAQMERGRAADAEGEFARLLDDHPDVIPYHIAHAEAQMRAGNQQAGLESFEQAHTLFPRNVPVTVSYAEALMSTGNATRAHEILLDLFNMILPTPEQARLIAMAASAEGDMANAYYYMAEHYLLVGDLPMAISQLQLALSQPGLERVQRARFEARLVQIQGYLTPKERKRMEQASRFAPRGA